MCVKSNAARRVEPGPLVGAKVLRRHCVSSPRQRACEHAVGFAPIRSPLIARGCDCAPVLPGVPAKITGAHTMPMAKIVDPRILDMSYTLFVPRGS